MISFPLSLYSFIGIYSINFILSNLNLNIVDTLIFYVYSCHMEHEDAAKRLPVQKSSEKPCCGSPSEETTLSDNATAAGTTISSIATKSTAFWICGFSGLAGITLLVFSTGIVPGLKPEVFWYHVLSNLVFVGKNIWSILPFFLLSVCISAWVTVSGFADRIKAVFNRREKIAIAGAAIVGATIPLCSCGVIPLIAALLASGVPLGPVMAFWISSPLMSPSIFVLTGAVLGMDFAVARLVTAVLMGAGAGYLVYALSSFGILNNQLQGLSLSQSSCCGSDENTDTTGPSGSKFWNDFWPKVLNISLFLGKWLLIAYILESLIVHYIDPIWISSALGKNQVFSIPLATAIGIPVYTSGVGAIPIVEGLLKNGMSHGAALAFLVAGPVTTIPAMTAVFALVKRQTFTIYLCIGIGGSLIAGYVYQAVMS
ncbi:MAG: permease [Deltaproteobacteria bacterium]|nr:MAG: permease [Deltaproteobacteria bacterium]